MLTTDALETILAAIPRLRIGVLGDLFLDRYLDIDPALTEPSLETRLDAYQVVGVRSTPGAAGTVINNLAALGVGAIPVISVIGDDGEGYELRQALARMPAVETNALFADRDRRTPTYTKPMLGGRELNRIDIKNRTRMSADREAAVAGALKAIWLSLDALIVVEQVFRAAGVITFPVQHALQRLATSKPAKIVLVDSRERINAYEDVHLKPNERECLEGVGSSNNVEVAAAVHARRAKRTVFCTLGARGIIVAEPTCDEPTLVPAVPVTGPIDPVGAGDSADAAIACALACGQPALVAAEFANLVASITIQQIGTTGTATPAQIRSAHAAG